MKKAIFEMGESSVKLPMPVYIVNGASIAGTKEGQGPLGSCIDHVLTDDQFGADSWEAAECKLQKETGFKIIKQTEDLHKEPIWENNIETEHEKMFEEQGITKKAVIAKIKCHITNFNK